MNAILLQCCSSAAKAMKCGCETTLSTSKNDIAIAAIICGTFVIIALIVALSVWAWKNKEIKSKEKERKDIIIENNVYIGTQSFIAGGVHIGHHSVVGAGTIVRAGEYPPYSLVVGNPAVVKPGYYLGKLEEGKI